MHEALHALEPTEPRLAKVVEMRYFGGYSESRDRRRARAHRAHRAARLGQGAAAADELVEDLSANVRFGPPHSSDEEATPPHRHGPELPDLVTLSRLLDEAMDLEPAQLEAWLAALPQEHGTCVRGCEQMLAARAAHGRRGLLAEGPEARGSDRRYGGAHRRSSSAPIG